METTTDHIEDLFAGPNPTCLTGPYARNGKSCGTLNPATESRLGSTLASEICESVYRQAVNDYFYHPKERGSIRSWMAGDAPVDPDAGFISFIDCCHVLGIEDIQAAIQFIKEYQPAKGRVRPAECRNERSVPMANHRAKSKATPLAKNRVRKHRAGHTGPEWLPGFAGDLDRVEARVETPIWLPGELDSEARASGRPGVAIDHEEAQSAVVGLAVPNAALIIAGALTPARIANYLAYGTFPLAPNTEPTV